MWLNITAATWDKVPVNSGFYVRRNSSNSLERKYVRCADTLPKWGWVIKPWCLLGLLCIHLCLRGFHLPWDRCNSCRTALFTGPLWASFSIKSLSILTRKHGENSHIRLKSTARNTDTASASGMDTGRVNFSCLGFLQQNFSEGLCDLEGKSLLVSCTVLLPFHTIYYSFFPRFPPHPNRD